MDSDSYFSGTYPVARDRFRAAARRFGAALDSLDIGVAGPDGEALSIDIAWFGAPSPVRVVIHSSGLHGVEGFAGSAIQIRLLENLPAIRKDGALIFVHVLNPYGMAWLRRTNENNVDLNRNFLPPDSGYSGSPPGYERLNEFLNPERLHAIDPFTVKAGWLLLRHGMAVLKRAVVVGQYDYPRGLFFGGKKLEEGPRLYEEFLTRRLSGAEALFAIDVHTGLGAFGVDALLVSPSAYPRLRGRLGDRLETFADGGVAYPVLGGLHDMLARVLGDVTVDFVGQEFGTYTPIRVLAALRRENHAYHSGHTRPDHPSRQDLKAVFSPEDDGWRQRVLERGCELFDQACRLGMTLPTP